MRGGCRRILDRTLRCLLAPAGSEPALYFSPVVASTHTVAPRSVEVWLPGSRYVGSGRLPRQLGLDQGRGFSRWLTLSVEANLFSLVLSGALLADRRDELRVYLAGLDLPGWRAVCQTKGPAPREIELH